MSLLSHLLLGCSTGGASGATLDQRTMSRDHFDCLVSLASLNHVVVRGLTALLQDLRREGDQERIAWSENALATEHMRIQNAVRYLDHICSALETEGHDVAVIKSLDHWPDLGSDLDLYTDADPTEIIDLMRSRFDATIAPRSWGDRLANKWNFVIPELPELVEIHMGRLGQTGEQIIMASRLVRRTRVITLGDYEFRVPSVSDRILISTLQRMYRHFYFRLCDIVDSASLLAGGVIDFDDLHAAAENAGIWEGVATYLLIVSDYVKSCRGSRLDLPPPVVEAARFGGDEIYLSKNFLRVPILPQSAALYGKQLAGLMRKRELHSGARLSLLPWLATAAVVGQKITGSDKGIW